MSVQAAEKLLQEMARSACDKDYAAHMDLISQEVSVFGIPGFEVIGYDDWARQCRHEFDNNILKSVSYGPMKVVAQSPGRVMFKTLETVEANDGTRNCNGIEIIIQKEDDGKWRVLQERILPEDEAAHDGISVDAGSA
ncbi:MAG: nuclear transport factor 2 family protein [Acidiferrobacterales bacterium]